MKTKVLSLVLLILSWLPTTIAFLFNVNLLWDYTVNRIVEIGAGICSVILLPGLGGLIAGWHWRGWGMLVAGVCLLSSIAGVFAFMSVTNYFHLIPPASGRIWVEGPVALLPLFTGIPGTLVAIFGAFAGLSLRREKTKSHENETVSKEVKQ